MSYLYPQVKSSLNFVAKRYLRIVPVVGMLVFGLWFTQTFFHNQSPFLHLLLIAIVALGVRIGWLLLKKLNQVWGGTGKIIFFSYLIFQLVWLGISVVTSLGFGQAWYDSMSSAEHEVFFMLSNLSLTMYFQKNLVVLIGVMWSLIPEIFYYLIYPFLVAPMLQLSKKLSGFHNFIISLCVIFILFSLDQASRSFFSLHGIFISRAVGFVVGMWAGSIYLSQGAFWQKIEKTLSHPIVNICVLGLFFWAVALEWPDRFHQIRYYVAFHYLFLSLIFGLTILAAISQKSIINRFFSHKIFTFLGMISYSLYLSHPLVIERISSSQLIPAIQKVFAAWPQLFILIRGSVLLAASIGFAYCLYLLVESVYFVKAKPLVAENRRKEKPKSVSRVQLPTTVQVVLGGLSVCLGIVIIFSGDYVPSLTMVRHSLPKKPLFSELLVTPNNPAIFSFVAQHDNLSVVMLDMDYAHEPSLSQGGLGNEAQLVFELHDEQGNLIIQSIRQPQELEGVLRFPFGFPTISQSKDKTYQISLRLENTAPSDQIFIYQTMGIVSQYTTVKQKSVSYILNLIYRRGLFALSFPQVQTTILIIIGLVGLMIAKNKISRDRDQVVDWLVNKST